MVAFSVPSNLDLICNTAGGVGAVWAQMVGPRVFLRIAALEHYLVAPIPHAELGLTLLGLWLLVPLSPEILLLVPVIYVIYSVLVVTCHLSQKALWMIEASVTAFNAIAVGLLSVCCVSELGSPILLSPYFSFFV